MRIRKNHPPSSGRVPAKRRRAVESLESRLLLASSVVINELHVDPDLP
jgi:hypothetical protein